MLKLEEFEDNQMEEISLTTQSTAETPRRKKVVIIALTSLVVVALVVGIFAGLFHSTNSKTATPNEPQAADSTTLDIPNQQIHARDVNIPHTVGITNNCSFPIWIGVLGNPNYPLPFNGGWRMNASESVDLELGQGWSGRFWGRTNCNSQGWCQTGDCGGKIECAGAGGNPPASLAEFSFDTPGGDYYDISLVDGYNLPMGIIPRNATRRPFSGDWRYHCQYAGCNLGEDLNDHCPSELQVHNTEGEVVACLSACEKFNEDQFCCRGDYSTPSTCPPTEYTTAFKNICPEAYSYAYDDSSSLFTCDGIPQSDYDVVFCP